MLNLIFSGIFLIAGFLILNNKKFSWKGMPIDMSSNHLFIFVGGGMVVVGVLWLYSTLKSMTTTTPNFSICPKCKETYKYSDLKDGKCKKCNIDTVDKGDRDKGDSRNGV